MKALTCMIIGIQGLLVVAVGFSAALGHLAGIKQLYQWDETHPGMALSTAICFIVLGSAVTMLATLVDKHFRCSNFRS